MTSFQFSLLVIYITGLAFIFGIKIYIITEMLEKILQAL